MRVVVKLAGEPDTEFVAIRHWELIGNQVLKLWSDLNPEFVVFKDFVSFAVFDEGDGRS